MTRSEEGEMSTRCVERRAAVLLCAILLVPVGIAAQAAPADPEGGSARLHPLVGVFGGRLDPQGAPDLDILGARVGVGFGELVQLTGFYWREVDTDEREFLDGRGWGGEVRMNLNAGFGVTPFLTAGVARLRLDTLAARTAATAGAGLMLPVGPVRLTVAATDVLLGVAGLDSRAEDTDLTHNWMFTAGLTAAFGRARAPAPATVARPEPPRPPPARVVTPPRVVTPADTVWVEDRDEEEVRVRNYQSEQRIEVPLPLEGFITIRYGPEPQPVIAAAPPGAVVVDTSAVPGVPGVWPAPSPPPDLSEAAARRIIDGTVAALLPQLEARDARRQADLQAELRAAIAAQHDVVRELVRQEMARYQPGVAAIPPAVPAPLPTPAPATAARPAAPAEDLEAAIDAVAARLQAARAELARLEAERATDVSPPGPGPVDLRTTLAELAARHPGLLSTAETERGPALVLADVAFGTGETLPDERARAVIAEIAAMLQGMPPSAVFVHGHTDSIGPEVRNQQLSELRAEVVRSLLVQGGVRPGRVHALGFGAGHPIATNATTAGRALNRRVEIVIGAGVWNGGTP
jgi:outer membrane protein OmpA-like peptidoglycan-associated protein